jgi:hypothetical protein
MATTTRGKIPATWPKKAGGGEEPGIDLATRTATVLIPNPAGQTASNEDPPFIVFRKVPLPAQKPGDIDAVLAWLFGKNNIDRSVLVGFRGNNFSHPYIIQFEGLLDDFRQELEKRVSATVAAAKTAGGKGLVVRKDTGPTQVRTATDSLEVTLRQTGAAIKEQVRKDLVGTVLGGNPATAVTNLGASLGRYIAKSLLGKKDAAQLAPRDPTPPIDPQTKRNLAGK